MIGIFDSGVGGMTACAEVRRLLPQSDILYLADRKNAPYGTKAPDELIKLVRRDIDRLRCAGASKILVACCTASSMIRELTEKERQDVFQIISPAVRGAAPLGRVTVIATEHTARTSAFGREIKQISPAASVQEIPCQRLVALVEEGSRDGCITEECEKILSEVASAARVHGSRGIILGCTHFSHLENTIRSLLPRVKIINPAKLGAQDLAGHTKDAGERGKIIYTE